MLNEEVQKMNSRIKSLCLCVLVVACQLCFGQTKEKSPLDDLPPYIKQVTYFGERADFSHSRKGRLTADGKRILFLERTFGDVYEVELATGIIRLQTGHYYHEGYTRALYLANGDILLSGARKFDAENPQPSRSGKNAELWVLNKDLKSPPVALGEHCSEGPAVSRKRMTIAWTLQDEGLIFMGDIVYENGKPKLINKKLILDANNLPFPCREIETQNLRPPDEKELIFSAYSYQGTEVAGLDLETGKVVNYSNAPDSYEEPEGIFPDGKYTLVECDRHNRRGTQYIDIYKLALDGSGQIERLTHFADYPGYKASNPVVSDDGRFMAFQYAKLGDLAGVGRGILLFDLDRFAQLKTVARNARTPANDDDLRFWLENMVLSHRFGADEIKAATRLSQEQIDVAIKKFAITPANKPPHTADNLLILPYPGGRHCRAGFLDGAVDPQRETKVSVFTPWDPNSYVVVDVPEAIFSNLGLLYLAHTHKPFPTIWQKQGVELEKLEWNRRPDGSLDIERKLPNQITFGAKVTPDRRTVQMELWLQNSTDQNLSDLKVQNCVITARTKGFERHTNDNKLFRDPYVACRSEDGAKWIITAWENCIHPWANPDVPCFHSDPQFPNCPPGQTVRLLGRLWFYEGTDIEAEIERIKETAWRK